MFVLGNFVVALARIIDIVLTLYMWIIIARALISWVNADPYNQIVIFLYKATEPILRLVRRMIPFRNVGIDLSPMIVILGIIFLQYFLVETLLQFSRTL